ncbi:hypothetical protein [Bacillus sp. 1P06AnD]|uniref:hypothetical protein n=1 Tax=Bacillus sp. 1P06AnD TaxID=3132208 RepID=UPI0039A3BD47
MSKINKLIIVISSIFIISTCAFYTYQKKVGIRKQISSLNSLTILNQYFDLVDYSLKGNKLDVYMKLNSEFANLPFVAKYGVFQLGHRTIQYGLVGYKPFSYALNGFDVKLHGRLGNDRFEFTSNTADKTRIYNNKGFMKFNEQIITKADLKEHFFDDEQFLKEKTSNGFPKKEVYDHMVNLFATLTNRGIDYRAQQDNSIIIEQTAKKFALQKREIGDIYLSYYLYSNR